MQNFQVKIVLLLKINRRGGGVDVHTVNILILNMYLLCNILDAIWIYLNKEVIHKLCWVTIVDLQLCDLALHGLGKENGTLDIMCSVTY